MAETKRVEELINKALGESYLDLIKYGNSVVHYKIVGGEVVVENITQEFLKVWLYDRD